MHVSLLLEMAAEAVGPRIAVGGAADGISYAELAAQSRATAAWLLGLPGDKLVFLGLNGTSLPVALFGAALAGRPFAPLNYRLPDAELRRLVARTAPSVAIVDDGMLPRVAEIEGVLPVARSRYETLLLDPALREATLPEADQDVAVQLFTSGTTGEPKVALLRHRHLASYVLSSVEFCAAADDEAALVSVPPYHIAGISAVLTGTYSGRRIVYLPAFSAEDWVDAAVEEKITQGMVVPTMLGRILDLLEARGETLPDFKALSYGGGRMPQPVIERALRLFPRIAFTNAYGLTETSSTVAVLGPDDHRRALDADDHPARRRLGSVGKPLPNIELEIRGPDGAVLPHGTAGEVYVRGDQIAGEYLGRKAIQNDGWFATNDSGWLDEEGYLFIEGRLDDVIVRGGENISPGEIEDTLRGHAGVKDVAVLGIPDDRWGERVAAVVVPRDPAPSTAQLADWVKSRLRSTRTPETWEFRSALPYNETGKLLRRVLKLELTQLPPAR
jgi:fatty-acyl-CoA synthase